MKALSCLTIFHGAVEKSFENHELRKLWRIDRLNGQYYLMIVSSDKPDLSAAVNQFGFPDDPHPWESLCYDTFLEKLEKGSRWHFRLTANPTRSVYEGNKERGAVHAHVGVKHQTQWFLDRAKSNGFLVNEDEVTIVNSRWYFFRKKSSTNHKVSLLSVTYEGVMEIEDPMLATKALICGIGREKAYGQGMLTLAR